MFCFSDSFLKEEDKEAFFKSLQDRVVKADSLLDGSRFISDPGFGEYWIGINITLMCKL